MYVWIDNLQVQFSLSSLQHESNLIPDHGRLFLIPGAVPRLFWVQLLALELPHRVEFGSVPIPIVCAHMWGKERQCFRFVLSWELNLHVFYNASLRHGFS